MSKPTSSASERLIQLITEYLTSHPHAADTVEGILQWWLAGADSARGLGIRDVEEVVTELVRRGVLECRTLPDGTQIYARGASWTRA